jgi:transcriptional regulator with XRE-family HTH domain
MILSQAISGGEGVCGAEGSCLPAAWLGRGSAREVAAAAVEGRLKSRQQRPEVRLRGLPRAGIDAWMGLVPAARIVDIAAASMPPPEDWRRGGETLAYASALRYRSETTWRTDMATRKPGVAPQVTTIEAARQQLDLSYREIAQALHAEESTVHRWRNGSVLPTPVFIGRLGSLGDLLVELNRTFARQADTREWLANPNPALQNKTPLEVILGGQMDRVTGMLYALNAGLPA